MNALAIKEKEHRRAIFEYIANSRIRLSEMLEQCYAHGMDLEEILEFAFQFADGQKRRTYQQADFMLASGLHD